MGKNNCRLPFLFISVFSRIFTAAAPLGLRFSLKKLWIAERTSKAEPLVRDGAVQWNQEDCSVLICISMFLHCSLCIAEEYINTSVYINVANNWAEPLFPLCLVEGIAKDVKPNTWKEADKWGFSQLTDDKNVWQRTRSRKHRWISCSRSGLTSQDRRVFNSEGTVTYLSGTLQLLEHFRFGEKLVNEPFMKVWPLGTPYISSGVFGHRFEYWAPEMDSLAPQPASGLYWDHTVFMVLYLKIEVPVGKKEAAPGCGKEPHLRRIFLLISVRSKQACPDYRFLRMNLSKFL